MVDGMHSEAPRNGKGRRSRRAVLAACAAALCAMALVVVFAGPQALLGTGGAGAPDALEVPASGAAPAGEAGEGAAASGGDVAGDEAAQSQQRAASPQGARVVPAHVLWAENDAALRELAADESAYVAGEVLVERALGVSADQLAQTLQQAYCVGAVELADDDFAFDCAVVPLAQGVSVVDALVQLERLPGVQSVQPNFTYRLAESSPDVLAAAAGFALGGQASQVNDPLASQQWALESIHAYEAWDVVKAGDAGDDRVTVAVIDNGCLATHEDLAANVVATYNAVSKSEAAEDMSAPFGDHGTHVAGIISAVANNGVGVAGASYNAGLLPIQTNESQNGQVVANTSSLLNAYAYIQAHKDQLNIRVANMSMGGAREYGSAIVDDRLTRAVNAAADAGILTVFSAGNDVNGSVNFGTTAEPRWVAFDSAYLNYPCDWVDRALGVIALDNSTPPKRTTYSNYNMEDQTTKDLAAPGGSGSNTNYATSIASTSNSNDQSYAGKHGTSMAAPYVSAVAALVFTAAPDLTADDVAEILCETATDLGDEGWDVEFGAGEVNAFAAVANAGAHIAGETSLLVGGTTTLSLALPGEWEWASSDPSVATVKDGVVRGVSGGTATITAQRGSRTLQKDVTVFAISFGNDRTMCSHTTVPLVFNEKPDTGMWLISSSDESVARIREDESGLTIDAGVPGTATITATLRENSKLTVSFDLTVVAEDFSRAKVALKGWTYDGRAHEPAVTVTLDGKTVPASEYRVAYSGNVNAGTCTATVTPLAADRYAGTARGTCTVACASLAKASVGNVTNRRYTAKPAKAQAPTVKVGGRALTAGSDFAVTYQNAKGKAVSASKVKAIGTYYAVATGRGNYTGTVRKAFKVVGATVSYRTHVQRLGWQSWRKNGTVAGTSGRSLRLQAARLKVSGSAFEGGIQYRAHVQNQGWQTWRNDGAAMGAAGRGLRLEAVRIELYGDMARYYNVYYRVHAQDFGWMGWAKNGARAGSAGYSRRLEGLQVKLVPKGGKAPGSTKRAFRQK